MKKLGLGKRVLRCQCCDVTDRNHSVVWTDNTGKHGGICCIL